MTDSYRMGPGVTASDPRLGRVARFDERSRQFPIRALLAPLARPRSYTWRLERLLDQGQTPMCVGFSIAHEIAARPVVVATDDVVASKLYQLAQRYDEWPGESYEGSSVLGGMKGATELGYYREYRWAFGFDDAVLSLGHHGPVVLGINWYGTMFEPDLEGRLHVSGSVAGGHAILANRVDVRRERVWLANSWGVGWGLNGGAWLSFDDLDRLLHEDGECCVPVARVNRP